MSEYTCPKCGGSISIERYEKFCSDCYYAVGASRDVSVENHVDEWEAFWNERANYDGKYGEDRRKCVGGFVGAY